MRQNIILTILIFVTTNILCAQTNTGGFGKCALENPDFNYRSQLQNFSFATSTEWKAQTKMGFCNYIYWNKGASYNPGTLWINGIPKELDIFVSKARKIYVNNDDVCAANEAIRKLLWKDGKMQTLTKPRETQKLFQFATDDINRNAQFLMQLCLIATQLYFDHRQLENDRGLYQKYQKYLNSRPMAYTP